MGILTDFVIATVDEAAAIGDAIRPADTWPTLEAKGVETINLMTLCSIVTGTEYEDDLELFPLVGGNEEQGPWVFQLPDMFLNAIAAMPDGDVTAVASAWAQTEEMEMGGWPPAETAEFLRDFKAHVQRAVDGGSSMFLWLSL